MVDENGAEGKTTRVDETLGRDPAVDVKDTFELLVKVFDGMGTELVKDSAHGCAWVAVRIGTFAGGNDGLVGGSTGNMQGRIVVVLVVQEITSFGGQFREQTQGMFIIGDIGGREVSRQRDPDGSYGGDQVQFPPVDPSVPARLGPVGFRVDGGVQHNAGFPGTCTEFDAVGEIVDGRE